MKSPDPPSWTSKYRILEVVLWAGNHVMRWQLQHFLAPPAFALLETVGRRTGKPRQTCVGNGLTGDIFWVVAAHGQQADWVRNIRKEPQVRVLVNRAGAVVPPRSCQKMIPASGLAHCHSNGTRRSAGPSPPGR